MKVRCLSNSIPAANSTRPWTAETYDLTPRRHYTVAGILFHSASKYYLVRDDKGSPVFAYAQLFQLVDPALDSHWLISDNRSDHQESDTIIGYRELVAKIDGVSSLVGRKDPQALAAFENALRSDEKKS